jgi:hypothetical protein
MAEYKSESLMEAVFFFGIETKRDFELGMKEAYDAFIHELIATAALG